MSKYVWYGKCIEFKSINTQYILVLFQKGFSVIYMAVIVPVSILLPIYQAVKKYSQLTAELKIISWFLFASAVSNIISAYFASNSMNNMPVMHVYTFVEFALLALFYKKLLDSERSGRIINLLIPSFFMMCVLNVLYFQDLYTYNTYTKSIEALLILIFSIVYFVKVLDKVEVEDKNQNVLTYINSGLLIYFSGSFIWFVIFNLTIGNVGLGVIMWSIHATLLLVLYILIAVALWKHKS